MIKDTLKQIEDAKSKLASLEMKAATELSSKLTNLHKDLGFESRDALISALKGLGGSAAAPAGKKRGRKPGAAKKAAAPKAAKTAAAPKAAAAGGKKRAKRARITPELKDKIVAAVKAGGKGAAIAKQFGISVPSLQNIKKAAGLIKARKK